MTRLAIGLTVLSLSLTCSAAAYGQTTMRLTNVLMLNVLDPKSDVDVNALETQALDRIATAQPPGMRIHLVRKDRGNRPGRLMIVGLAPGASDAAALQHAIHQSVPADFVNSGGRDVEYRLVGAERLGALPEVDVLGIHYIRVRPDRVEAFDRFVAERLHPIAGTLSADLRLIYYKPVRGDEPGNYITVFALTKASRDKYWPGGKDSDALRTTFQPAHAVRDELQTYLVEGSFATGNLVAAVFESRQWADWVIVTK